MHHVKSIWIQNSNEERYCNEPDFVNSRTRSSVSPNTDFYLTSISAQACVRLWICIRWYPDQSPEKRHKKLSLVSSASALSLPPDRRLSGPILGGGDLAVPDTMAQQKPQWPPMSQGCYL
ncbi:hypothetical protein DPMN_111774 [Dreissena polymorpha]|uniref:Uncharacterized protein n=1 Tax=Dreissena polymorpha TaxID=45954 RepID=A0A9D4QQ97_DREPO|nr:hypothetical protein DPMN_111774 [Dreissena polymorpha]